MADFPENKSPSSIDGADIALGLVGCLIILIGIVAAGFVVHGIWRHDLWQFIGGGSVLVLFGFVRLASR